LITILWQLTLETAIPGYYGIGALSESLLFQRRPIFNFTGNPDYRQITPV